MTDLEGALFVDVSVGLVFVDDELVDGETHVGHPLLALLDVEEVAGCEGKQGKL